MAAENEVWYAGRRWRRVSHGPRGRAEIRSFYTTSDGFIIARVKFGEGADAYMHDVLLGRV